MVYLKEIELENFKTFGGKARVPFNPGYTAIIGPNGSGKSNILDAIMFVIGPKSSKSIRAENLADLIFNGGRNGKPASYCKVSLLFDNKDRAMPIDRNVVRLTRHVKLSGSSAGYTSSFYINGERSSQKEFTSLLTSAGILSDGYNIVKQGLITSVVETTPTERRHILDEVSGAAHFDEQIEKAMNERAETESNIDRMKIILAELSDQLKGLKKDRESAMKYQELLQKKQEAEALIAYRNRESVLTEINSITGDIKEYERSIEELKSARTSLIEKKKEIELSLSEIEAQIRKKGGDAAVELKKKLDSLRVEMARAKSVIENSEDNIAEIKRERKQIAADIKRLEKDQVSGRKKLDDTTAKISILEKELAGLKKDIAEAEEKAGANDSSVREIQKKISEIEEQIAAVRKKEHDLSIQMDKASSSLERSNKDLASAEERLSNLEFELKDIKWSISELNKGLKSTKKDRDEIQSLFYKKRNEEKELLTQQGELDSALKRLNREYSRLKAREEAEKSAGGMTSRAVDAVLNARNEGKLKGIHGTVEELVSVEDGFETPFLIAGGGRLHAIVVDDDGCAAEAMEYLKKNSLGRATFLPLNKMVVGRPRGKAVLAARKSLGFLMEHLDYDERYEAALWYVLGDTVVVSNLSQARELMGGIRIVTSDGQLIEASGAMIGGSVQKRGRASSSMAEIKRLNEEIKRTSAALDDVESRLQRMRSDLAELESRLRETAGGENEVKLSAFEKRKKEVESSISQTKKEISELKDTLESLESDRQKVEAELMAVTDEIQSLESKRTELHGRLTESIKSDLGQRLQAMRNTLSERLEEMSRLTAEKNTLENSQKLIEGQISSLKKKDDGLETKMKEMLKQMESSRQRLDSLTVEIKGLEKADSSLGKEIADLQKKRDGLYKESVDIEGKIDATTSKIETTGDFIRGLEVKLSVANEKLKEIEKEIEGIDIEVPPRLPSLSKLKRTVQECETNISLLGAVNMKALTDYDEKNKRHGRLKEELERLEEQKKRLIELVDELEKKKKERFMKLYDEVNRNFSEIYTAFSRGGKASLELENPESPFEGGLNIKASPSGKSVRLLRSLSGGEKSLAALSFIFAIQHTNPSPFYIFDEVDMFLDADNAEVVSRIIKENSKDAQFIQITLRKVTLKQIDHIIGVMIQRNGVSEVVMKPNIDEFVEESRKMEVKT